jgi:type III pantothenate kinase
MSSPFLAIDIGNTRLKWALYDAAHPVPELQAQGAEFLDHIERLADGPWADLPAPASMLGCVVAGDAVRRRAEEQINERFDCTPRWVMLERGRGRHRQRLRPPHAPGRRPLRGDDRRAPPHAGRTGRGAQARPMVVVMIGTAVTVEAIDADGKFLGGLILPGHGIMLRALESGTAGLHVPTGEVREFPTNTSDALTSGGTYAIAGAVERMVQHVRSHCGAEPACYMTGGAGWKMAPVDERALRAGREPDHGRAAGDRPRAGRRLKQVGPPSWLRAASAPRPAPGTRAA